jgi:hypothetical protein
VSRVSKYALRWGAVVVGVAAGAVGTWSLPSAAATNGATLYREALATTKAWSVHYASDGDISHVPILESGDAGPASGTQVVLVGSGAKTDNASLVVIGDLTYIKGNAIALEDLIGLTTSQATAAVGKWVVFSTTNPAYTQVVAGVRSKDVAQEVALKGPYALGSTSVVDGYHVDAIYGTQKLQGTNRMRVVLYVRSTGRHQLVEEDTVGAGGKPNGLEHMVFSKWGETVQPRAPDASITLGTISST